MHQKPNMNRVSETNTGVRLFQGLSRAPSNSVNFATRTLVTAWVLFFFGLRDLSRGPQRSSAAIKIDQNKNSAFDRCFGRSKNLDRDLSRRTALRAPIFTIAAA